MRWGPLHQPPTMRIPCARSRRGGIDEFYKGSIAQTIVDEVQRLGGLLTMEDMASYTSVEREPISTTYHGYEIVTQGPPSNGGAPMLEMFNILENYDLVSMGFNTRNICSPSTRLCG